MSPKKFLFYLFLVLSAILIGGTVGFVVYSFGDLPEVQQLEEYRPSITTRVYSARNKLLAEFYLENRTPVKIDEVPETLTKAIIAAEDGRFHSHHGIDLRGIARAMYRNIRAGKILEGGSTLTQQLSKILFLTPERSYARKLKELVLALKIEQRYTKKEILSFYLNQIYFGNGAYGVESAAQTFFGKSVNELSLAECALLAGLPRSPKYYSPFTAKQQAHRRRSYVLGRMLATGFITQPEADAAEQIPLPDHPVQRLNGTVSAPYFVEYVRQKIEERFGSGILYTGGLNITTSIDDTLQRAAEDAVLKGLQALEGKLIKKRTDGMPLQAALVAIDPSSGHILAMVGGRDFSASQFNRAWQALRQPGSAFKPIIYATALERGYSAVDMLQDTPLTVKLDRRNNWTPENFTRTYQGAVTLRKALAQSLNVPTVRLLASIGIAETVDFAHKIGITSPLNPVLSLALGSSDVTLLEMTSAYACFANHGVRLTPIAVKSVSDNSGRVLYINDTAPVQAIKPETAYLITNLLKGVIEQGTGWKARELNRPAGGKTGTTNDNRDAWFIGYTPTLVAGIWVGYDDQRSLGVRTTGSRAALPIWLDFMKQAIQGTDAADFAIPENIIMKNVDPRSGLLSTEQCSRSIREAFVPGTEPRKYCDESSEGQEETPVQDEAPE